jgi:hypothetical protein
MLTRMRAPCRSALVVCCLAFLVVLFPAPSVGAATGYELTNGWVIQDATVRCPGSAPRAMSGKHAAAFIQAWYPATFFGSLTEATPPAALPVCKFVAHDTISYQVSGANGEITRKVGKYTFHALWASQGKKAWVGLPPQVVGPGAVVSKLHWFVPTPRAIQAWGGKLDPIPNEAPTTTTTIAPAAKDSSSGSSATPWIIVAVVAGVALVGAGAVVVRRRGSAAKPPPPEPTQ